MVLLFVLRRSLAEAPVMLCMVQSDKVIQYMTKFKRSSSEPYTLITPSTPLADLEEFLRHNIFALGTASFLLPPRPISRPAQSQLPPHPH